MLETVKNFPSASFGIYKAMDACRNLFSSCLTAVDACTAEILKKIPAEHRLGRTLPLLTGTVTAIPLIYAYSQKVISGFFALQCLSFTVSLIYNRACNCRAKDIRQVIENSHLEKENKEGVALILNASKWTDYNYAFGDNEGHLREVELIAKKFFIESQTVSSAQQLSETIEEVCKKSEKPVKLVIIRGHGSLKEIRLGLFSSVKSDDAKLVEALKKTDQCAHIILQSCSTGKLRSGKGISFADQLSLNLPGRMVTGASNDAGVALVEHNDYPQGIALLCMEVAGFRTPAKQISTYSFRVTENKRIVKTLLPLKYFNIEQMKRNVEECQPATDLDAHYQTGPLINEYKYHFNFSFKDLFQPDRLKF